MTPLDQAHALMEQYPDTDAYRLRFYERFAESELYLLLDAEPDGDQISPQILTVEDETYLLAFDREERLADFAETGAPYAALPGRDLVAMVVGQGVGVGLNLGVAASNILLSDQALDWLHEMLGNAAKEIAARPTMFRAPALLSGEFATALAERLGNAAGLARQAYLVQADYDDGHTGAMLGFIDATAGAEAALRQMATEAVSFTSEGTGLDIAFFTSGSEVAAKLAKAGLAIDIPEPAPAPKDFAPTAPGMDPDTPPRLR